MRLADLITWSLVVGGLAALGLIIWSYVRGLRRSPRDMWFLFLYKFIEYSAYGAMNITLILWLSKDCGLGDIAAGTYISGWSMMLSIMGMVAGALVDTIGIRRTLILSVVFLFISRLFMAFVTHPVLIFIVGFVPLAIGFAIVGPLVSVAIKRYTTKEGAALGFALFYVIMNIAYAVGGVAFDWFRDTFGLKDAAGKTLDENAGFTWWLPDGFGADGTALGIHFSTYQLIFVFGMIATLVSLAVIFLVRDGVRMTPEGPVIDPPKAHGSGLKAVENATRETGRLIASVARERYFWIFIGLLSLTLFVRFIFFHFHYTFPKYGIRVLGEGAKIGNIYGVLNPVLIVYFVPLVAWLTKKVSSYKMLIVGATISSLSCFIAVLPATLFAPLTDSVLGELIFIKWLGMATGMEALLQNPPTPEYWPLIVFIFVFTIGEAIWSPRLMQFTAEIAPEGREGTYIALSILPFFAAKFFVGPMSGLLLKAYVPVDEAGKSLAPYADHALVWAWIGGMALLSPIGLLLFRGWFHKHTHART